MTKSPKRRILHGGNQSSSTFSDNIPVESELGSETAEQLTRSPGDFRHEVKALKRELLLRAACETFYEYGYQSTTVDMITSKVSGTKSIFYYNYKDKLAVLEAIYDIALSGAQKVIDSAISASDTPVEALQALAKAYAKWVVENQIVVGVFWREERNLSKDARARAALGQKSIDDRIAQVLQNGMDAGVFNVADVQFTSRAVTGMITFTYTWWREHRRLSPQLIADNYAEMSLRLAGFKG